MLNFGYAKQYHYTNDGTLLVQVRVPSIHGAYDISNYMGKTVRNYTRDADLPWYQSMLLPHLPSDGEVVVIGSTNDANSDWIVLGLTGASYQSGATNI